MAEEPFGEKSEEEPEKQEIEEAPIPEKPKAFLSDLQTIIKKGVEDVYNRGFYGTKQEDGTLLLSPVETMFSLERNRIELHDERTGTQIDLYEYLQRLYDKHQDLWTQYLVYRDLRSRGYIVKQGLSEEIPFRVYPRGSEIGKDTSKYLIYIVKEGVPIELSKLDKATTTVKGIGKKLILAVLNRQGEATYYQISQVSI
ncbi:MAG: tRNA-intron lyase [Candidatus Atabeyarchaeum deiterrae]|jgi:tRNA-intron endonuclease